MDEHRAVVVAGLGLMGGAIAVHLASAGFEVYGSDPDPAACARASCAGVRPLASLDERPLDIALVVASLPSPSALDDVVQALCRWPSGARRLVELSTLDLADKERARRRLAEVGIAMLDAPISGTGAQAVTRDLSVYVSGDEADWRAVREVVSAFALRPRYVGAFGDGMRLKLVANLLVAIHNVATAEAMALAIASGLDPEMVIEVVREGAGSSRIFELRSPLMAARAYTPPTMKLDVWSKDMALISAFARARGVATPVFDATRPVYEAALQERPLDDTAAVFEVVRKTADGSST